MLDTRTDLFRISYGVTTGLKGASKRGRLGTAQADPREGRDGVVKEMKARASAPRAAPDFRTAQMVIHASSRTAGRLIWWQCRRVRAGTCKDRESCGTTRISSSRAA